MSAFSLLDKLAQVASTARVDVTPSLSTPPAGVAASAHPPFDFASSLSASNRFSTGVTPSSSSAPPPDDPSLYLFPSLFQAYGENHAYPSYDWSNYDYNSTDR